MSVENVLADIIESPAQQEAPEVAGTPAESTASPVEKAGSRQYRHVEASRWLVHSLLQYHYLPYWPRNVDRVFATVDITTGKVVAACVFAYPVLRCGLREQVFGLLAPKTLNAHFRQLVRWMVHPEHRCDGVGTALLKWACTKMDSPVLEAINRKWVPVEAFEQQGFIERSDGERHYYYRLKECRKRVDEILSPPAQAQPVQGKVLHEYPRIWCAKLHLQGQNRIVFVQPYDGAPLRTHVWGHQYYCVENDPNTTIAGIEGSGNYVEVTDVKVMAAMLQQLAAALPTLN